MGVEISASIDPASGVFDLGAAALSLIGTLQGEANSPDAVKAAQAKERLAQWDQLAQAQQNNDIETERAFLERRMEEIKS